MSQKKNRENINLIISVLGGSILLGVCILFAVVHFNPELPANISLPSWQSPLGCILYDQNIEVIFADKNERIYLALSDSISKRKIITLMAHNIELPQDKLFSQKFIEVKSMPLAGSNSEPVNNSVILGQWLTCILTTCPKDELIIYADKDLTYRCIGKILSAICQAKTNASGIQHEWQQLNIAVKYTPSFNPANSD